MLRKSEVSINIVCTDYDHESVHRSFMNLCESDPYFAQKIQAEHPNLIVKTSQILASGEKFGADVLIIEDDVICILQYLKVIDVYRSKYKIPTIKQIVACTKYDAANFLIDMLNHPDNNSSLPKLGILDFDLRELENSGSLMLKLANRIYDTFNEIELMGVSGFKLLKGQFQPLETWMRELHFETYRKEDLDDTERMVDNLEFRLNRHPVNNLEGINKIKQQGQLLYDKLCSEYTLSKVEKAIGLLDMIEKGIGKTCGKNEKFKPDKHTIPNRKGGTYNRVMLIQQTSRQKEILNKLLVLSEKHGLFPGRWEFLIYQICYFGLAFHFRCPKTASKP